MKQRSMGFSARLAVALVFAISFVLILGAVLFFRGSRDFPGQEAYYNIGIAKDMQKFNSNFLEEKDFSNYVFPLLITLISLVTTEKISVFILQAIAAFITIIFFVLIIYELYLTKKHRITAISLFIISPVILLIFLTSSKLMLALALINLSIYALMKEKFKISRILFIVTSIFGFVSAISATILTFPFLKKEKYWWFAANFLISALINAILFYLFPNLNFDISLVKLFNIFASLSGLGISLFAFALALIGINYGWREREIKIRLLPLFFSFLLLLLFSFANNNFTVFLSMPLSILASIGFTGLIERKWESRFIRSLTLLILVAGLLFSFGAAIYNSYSSDPSSEMIESLKFLKEQDDGKVLSSAYYGNFIKSFGEKEVLTNSKKEEFNSFEDELALKILKTRDLEKVSLEFKKNSLKYVYITDKMKQEIFNGEEEGILFILKYGNIFKNIYSNNGIEVWEFIN